MNSSIDAIVGRNDQNISSALNCLADLHVGFVPKNDDEYALIPDSDNKKPKKILRHRSNITYEIDRQISTIHRKIDQFQVKYFY